jgi:hypothetical protein
MLEKNNQEKLMDVLSQGEKYRKKKKNGSAKDGQIAVYRTLETAFWASSRRA